jgi:hypothetical protein
VAISPQANYTDRATSAAGEISSELLLVVIVAWSAQRIHRAINLGFLDQSRKYFYQVAPHLFSRGWMHTVPDPPLNKRTKNKQANSVALSPRANYTDWPTATCRRNLVPIFVDRGVSRGQRGGSPTVVNLSFLDCHWWSHFNFLSSLVYILIKKIHSLSMNRPYVAFIWYDEILDVLI